MPSKTFQQFDNRVSTDVNDFLVGYNSLEQKEKRYKLTTLAQDILPDSGLSTGSHQVRMLAKSVFNNYTMAAVNTNEEVIAWGANESNYRWGHLWYAGTASSHQPVVIPFYTGTPRTPGEVLRLKESNLKIEQLIEGRLHSLVRLSNGHIYSKSYADPRGASFPSGWSESLQNAPLQANARYLSGYFRITGFIGHTGQEVTIKKVGMLPIHGWNSNAVYWAVDQHDDLHIWGLFNSSAQAGESSAAIADPLNVTQNITALKQNVKDAQISGAHNTITILTKNKQIWHCGYNGNGQCANGNKTNVTVFTRARKFEETGDATANPVDNAEQLIESSYNHTNLGYISTTIGGTNKIFISGERVGGNNYYLRPNTPAAPAGDNSYAPGVTSPANDPFILAKLTGRHGYPTGVAITQNGRVYTAGTSSWGEGGRLNGSSAHLGSTWGQCSYRLGTALEVFGPGKLKAIDISVDESSSNAGAIGIIAETSTGYKYAFAAGYRTLTNSAVSFPESDSVFRPYPIGYSADNIVFGGDTTNHQWTIIHCDNQKVFALGYSGSGLITTTDKWIPLPQLIF